MRQKCCEHWELSMDDIRNLASSYEFQTMYSRMKDGLPVEFFINKKDFSAYQLNLLYWLEIYSNLYKLLSEDKRFLNEEVITNTIRSDAYLKFKPQYAENNNHNNYTINNNIKNKKKKNMRTVPGIPAVCYKPRG